MAQQRGALIVFEGIDRCGKSTQSAKLVENLNKAGVSSVHMRFPDRTSAIGKIINEYLTNATMVDDNAIHLLFSANRANILKALAEGKTVVVDRYAYSGVVFTAAKGLALEWCKTPDKGLPAPDLVVYLKISVEDAMKRGDFGNERYEKEDFQRKVKKLFEEEMLDSTWQVIDANQDREAIQERIEFLARMAAVNAANTPIGQLWV